MSALTDFEREAIRVALLKMFQPGSWLDICTLDKCVKLARVHPDERTYAALSALHCVSWSAMTPQMRQMTAQKILALFESEPLDLPSLHKSFLPEPVVKEGEVPEVKAPGIFKRLLGGVS